MKPRNVIELLILWIIFPPLAFVETIHSLFATRKGNIREVSMPLVVPDKCVREDNVSMPQILLYSLILLCGLLYLWYKITYKVLPYF